MSKKQEREKRENDKDQGLMGVMIDTIGDALNIVPN